MNVEHNNSTKLYDFLKWYFKYRVSNYNKRISSFYFNNTHIKMLTIEETIMAINDERLSLARFGDGEFSCMFGFIKK
jgi:hypothetical protein